VPSPAGTVIALAIVELARRRGIEMDARELLNTLGAFSKRDQPP
jgi:hypothetical protein